MKILGSVTTYLSIERNPFSAQNQTLKILQSIYFAYKVGIISSYSNRIMTIYLFDIDEDDSPLKEKF